MKMCAKCKENKSKTEFHKDNSKKDKLNHSCKDCISFYLKSLYIKDSAKQKEYYHINKNRDKERRKQYALDNREI